MNSSFTPIFRVEELPPACVCWNSQLIRVNMYGWLHTLSLGLVSARHSATCQGSLQQSTAVRSVVVELPLPQLALCFGFGERNEQSGQCTPAN